MSKSFYCRGDNTYHYKKEIPVTLRPFWQSSIINFNSFNTKYKNVVKKLLPEGYELYAWNKMYYEFSFVVRDTKGRFIYVLIPDVRFFSDEWCTHILIRTMSNSKDYTGGQNKYTSVFSLAKDIKNIYGGEKRYE